MPINEESSRNEVKLLVRQIFLLKQRHKFTKKQIHKLLYKFKQNLKVRYPNDPLLDIISFYWYYDGPFSPIIREEIDVMEDKGELKKTKYGRFELIKGKQYPTNDLKPYIIDELRLMLKPFNSYADFDKFTEEIYLDYAPYVFMSLFKYEFLMPLQKCVKKISKGQTFLGLDTDSTPYIKLDEFKSTLYKCEAKLPRRSIFNEFEELFSSFVTDTVTILDYMKKNWDYKLLKETCKTAENVWKRFAEGIRTQEDAQDPPNKFESFIEEWHDIFKSREGTLRHELDDFTLTMLTKTDYNESYDYEDKTTKEIISAIVNGYFSNEGFL